MAVVETAPIFRLDPNWESQKQTFEDYKLRGIQPDFYGRDARLSYPHVHHIHLAQTEALAKEWARKKAHIYQIYYRTNRRDDPENDYWFVYAHDDVEDKYLLLTIVGPDAHNNKKWRSYLSGLVAELVEPWIGGRLKGVI